MKAELEILVNEELHRRVLVETLEDASRYVWIATANVKDIRVSRGRGYVSALDRLAKLTKRGVRIRMLHAGVPSKAFWESFHRQPELASGYLEMQQCRRVHFKTIIVDGTVAYMGSANFTGAGMGARRAAARNFELGILTSHPSVVRALADVFDRIWMGLSCPGCALRERCTDPMA
ncbi:MAG: phospholipase D family protein [Deltaproteobacteria bacterium]|nr:phospholipase D family protein [Deltaproteobacteria bacterium]